MSSPLFGVGLRLDSLRLQVHRFFSSVLVSLLLGLLSVLCIGLFVANGLSVANGLKPLFFLVMKGGDIFAASR